MEILDELGPQRTFGHPGALTDDEDTQVGAFPRISSSLPSSKLHYGKTYSNLISDATMQALLNQLQWTLISLASTNQVVNGTETPTCEHARAFKESSKWNSQTSRS